MSYSNNEIKKARSVAYPIDELFISRWSPKQFIPKSIDEKTLMTIFEAGRLAPSGFNRQPWRVIYAHRETKQWDTLYSLLVPTNQKWTINASVLCLFISDIYLENGSVNRSHTYDTGAFWMSIALQATALGLHARGMDGFDKEKARELLKVPKEYVIEEMACIGYVDEGNETITKRKSLDEIMMLGEFKE